MAELKDLNATDASNTARFPENMNPSAVNDGARALEGMLARWYADTNGSISSGGSSNTYTLSASRTVAAYTAGDVYMFKANHANSGAATINVDSVGAKTIKKLHDQDLASGDIESGAICLIVYDGTNFQLISQLAHLGGTPTAITVADESSDTTCFPLFVTAATGDLGPKTGSNITFNSNTGELAATKMTPTNLGATTLTGAIAGGDQVVSAVTLKDYGETTQALGSAGGTRAVNLNNGNSVTATVSSSANTFTFSNPTASDELCGFTLELTNGGSQTVNWPASVDWAGASAPTLTTSGVDYLVFWTVNGGTRWYGGLVGAAFA